MEGLTGKKFKLSMTKEEMKRKGFKYAPGFEAYIYRFPVYRYRGRPLIFCEIGADMETGMSWFNIYDESGQLYAPYHNREYGVNAMIPDIDRAVSNELLKLGIMGSTEKGAGKDTKKGRHNENDTDNRMRRMPPRHNRRKRQGTYNGNMPCQE